MEEAKKVSPLTKVLVTGVSLGLVALLVLLVWQISAIAYNMIFSKMGVNESFFACLCIFLFAAFSVDFLALNPVSKILVERDKRMDGREKEIAQISDELKESQNVLSEERKVAQKEASEKFSQIKSQAVDEQRRTLQEARDKAAAELKKLKEKLQNDFDAEKAKLDQSSESLSKDIFATLLKSSSSKSAPASNVRTGA